MMSECRSQDESQRRDDILAAAMLAYQGGSLDAFKQLYAQLASPMRGYFRNALYADSAVADLVQETFLELHRARRTYQPGRPVRAWAFGIAHHVLLRHRDDERRRARHEVSRASDDLRVLEAVASLSDAPGVDLRDIDLALRTLSPGVRDVWVQHHLEGRRFADIAATLGIATAAARLRASRASAAIRRALGLQGEPEHD